MKAGNKQVGARLRIVLEPDVAIGPGKADILEGIKETGSIAAAGRRMQMSYKRAWLLVETSRGGRAHGGARLTPTGEMVLGCYRRMETLAEKAIASDMGRLREVLRDMSEP